MMTNALHLAAAEFVFWMIFVVAFAIWRGIKEEKNV